MLMLNLRAQLGNQMFQYAAVRTVAERHNYCFAYRGTPLHWKEYIRHVLGLPRRYPRPMLATYFQLGGESLCRNRLKHCFWLVNPLLPRSKYIGKYSNPCTGLWVPDFDPEFANLEDNTEIQAWLQSERYFVENRKNILLWFTPKPEYEQKNRTLEHQLRVPASRRCCIHVRRTDYKFVENNGNSEDWSLPISYYHTAIKELPRGLFYVFISDEPEWVEQEFAWLEPKYVSRGEAPVVDMFWMTLCKYNIIANSTFSWWGAWLNRQPDRVVIAPEYFVGWTRGIWNPIGIEVPDWYYITVEQPRPFQHDHCVR